MLRNVSIGFIVLAGIGALLFLYRTPTSTPTVPAQESSEAEFGGVSLRLEYATTTEAREFGLGGRESIAPDQAMLFVFPEDDYYGFWMNDMLISIDIFWLDSKGQVVSIQENVSPESYPDVFYPTAPARYVLETVAGFAQEHLITTDTLLLLKSFPTVSK